ncbi:ROK family transcriptional regulator [Paenibacillus sabinae]|uniref:Transcriptional regulator/sugar kinase n=1 Tax=Paenibacillus sabinae T27 TaxID=1268072 RepID=X4ZGK0_9BACL|nr:ROK family transcriptional regulator [Paenibacillus sabinae]AHV98656.1 transcriptional regulator/sugar kinase [Paenibacillus sabinae T27]
MIYEKTNNMEVKRINRNRIFRLIYKNEKLSMHEIASCLGMSLPTVGQNLKNLQSEGLITENGVFESTGGRKAKAISCIKDAKLAVGLDITNNHLSLVLVNLSGEIVKSTRVAKIFENSQDYIKEIGELVSGFIETSNIDKSKVLGVGIAVPGILSDDKQTVVYSHALGLADRNGPDFTKNISYPSVLSNDANAAGFAELWNTEAVKNAVYLSLSNTVGGSILLDNRLYPGDNQRSSEFGHMTLELNGRTCYCGKRGCLDAYCSASVLSNGTDEGLYDFFDLLKKGGKKQEKMWKEYLSYLAVAVNNLRMLFDCDVILGGYIGAYIEEYVDELRLLAAEGNTFEPDGSYLKVCRNKREAAAVGVALLHIERFLSQV